MLKRSETTATKDQTCPSLTFTLKIKQKHVYKNTPLLLSLLQHTLCCHGDAETAGQHVTRDHLVTLLLSDWLSAACFSPDFRGLCVEHHRREHNNSKQIPELRLGQLLKQRVAFTSNLPKTQNKTKQNLMIN